MLRHAASQLRTLVQSDRLTPASFGAALGDVPAAERDRWLDLVWDSREIPSDGLDLPRGCVPYLPCEVGTLLDAIEQAQLSCDDIFVDVGSGAGRAALLAHLLTGAGCIGLEIQPELVHAAQGRADWLGLSRTRFIEGDAAELIKFIPMGTVFFLYCPFGGERLARFLVGLKDIASARQIRVCCVDMPPLNCRWLTQMRSTSSRVDVYRSALPC